MRLSDAYEILAEFGLSARGIEDANELLLAFQPLKQAYKDGPPERKRIYDERLRPALVVIRSHLQQVHRKAFGAEASRVISPLPSE